MKVALVYDHINKIGGAERILTALHELFPDAPLFTAVYDTKKASWAGVFRIITSFMQNLPFARSRHELYPGVPILAFEQFDFSNFDLVISVTSAEAKAIITGPQTLHLCYCLTPTRFLWSHYEDYFPSKVKAALSLPFVSLLRMWDILAARRPDTLIAISKTIKQRLRHYYHREAVVIYPPVDTDRFVPGAETTGDYFLIVSRLVAYKHIEIAIEACTMLNLPLKIVGTGLEEKQLRKIAGKTVEFVGSLTEWELIGYYQNCRALLFTQDEDFGITAVEAMACGKPVIAYKGGGAGETVVAGVTGDFFWPQTTVALSEVLSKFDSNRYNRWSCRKQAEKFSRKQFSQKFSAYVKKEYQRFISVSYITAKKRPSL